MIPKVPTEYPLRIDPSVWDHPAVRHALRSFACANESGPAERLTDEMRVAIVYHAFLTEDERAIAYGEREAPRDPAPETGILDRVPYPRVRTIQIGYRGVPQGPNAGADVEADWATFGSPDSLAVVRAKIAAAYRGLGLNARKRLRRAVEALTAPPAKREPICAAMGTLASAIVEPMREARKAARQASILASHVPTAPAPAIEALPPREPRCTLKYAGVDVGPVERRVKALPVECPECGTLYRGKACRACAPVE